VVLSQNYFLRESIIQNRFNSGRKTAIIESVQHRFQFISGWSRDEITFKIKNPNKLTLVATDLTVRIYRVDQNKSRIISNGTLPDGIIYPQSTTVLQGDMLIPLSEIRPRLGERFIPDQLRVVLRANITIQGVNQTIWVGVTGYQDFPFHRLFG